MKSLRLPGPHPPKFPPGLQEVISFTIVLCVLSELYHMYADYMNIYSPLFILMVAFYKQYSAPWFFTSYVLGTFSKSIRLYSFYHWSIFYCHSVFNIYWLFTVGQALLGAGDVKAKMIDKDCVTGINTTGSHSSITVKQSKFYDRGSTVYSWSPQKDVCMWMLGRYKGQGRLPKEGSIWGLKDEKVLARLSYDSVFQAEGVF